MGNSKATFGQGVGVSVRSKDGTTKKYWGTGNDLHPRGRFQIELVRDGKVIHREDVPNGITNEGKDKILDDMFNDGTQTANASWYVGLIDNSGYTGVQDTDTGASHGGWNEFATYSEGTRVAWGSGAASSQSTTNSSPATFNITGSATILGVFIITVGTKSTFTGTLWATALFSASVPVTNGDQLRVTYTVSA